jgi:hypothetical protein
MGKDRLEKGAKLSPGAEELRRETALLLARAAELVRDRSSWITVLASASKTGKQVELTLPARELLQELNDLRSLRHQDIFFGLVLSRIALMAPEPGEGDGEDAA